MDAKIEMGKRKVTGRWTRVRHLTPCASESKGGVESRGVEGSPKEKPGHDRAAWGSRPSQGWNFPQEKHGTGIYH